MASICGRGDHASLQGVRGEAPTQSTSRAGDRQMMDDMGSEVFNLKLAVQEYEDRLAKLYQTEDRSMWRGSASLLVSALLAVLSIRGEAKTKTGSVAL